MKSAIKKLLSVSVFGTLVFCGFVSTPWAAPNKFVAAPVAYHTQHGKDFFSEDQCTQCHVAAGDSRVKQLNRVHCEECHSPELYPDQQPLYARDAKSCNWCHGQTQSIKGGLHGYKAHQNCTLCHSGSHVNDRPRRMECLNCHKDRVKHEPDAKKCSACHMFLNQASDMDPAHNNAPIGPALKK